MWCFVNHKDNFTFLPLMVNKRQSCLHSQTSRHESVQRVWTFGRRSYQLHGTAASPSGIGTTASAGQEAGWIPKQFWTKTVEANTPRRIKPRLPRLCPVTFELWRLTMSWVTYISCANIMRRSSRSSLRHTYHQPTTSDKCVGLYLQALYTSPRHA